MEKHFNTSKEMFDQLEWCGYETEAGVLTMNVAYIELKEYVKRLETYLQILENEPVRSKSVVQRLRIQTGLDE